jgi:hypothetical protein
LKGDRGRGRGGAERRCRSREWSKR